MASEHEHEVLMGARTTVSRGDRDAARAREMAPLPTTAEMDKAVSPGSMILR